VKPERMPENHTAQARDTDQHYNGNAKHTFLLIFRLSLMVRVPAWHGGPTKPWMAPGSDTHPGSGHWKLSTNLFCQGLSGSM
jgi:hypothetical protein